MIAELRLSRRERTKQRNKQEILEAALVEFSAHGYHDTSIQRIADCAEFAVGTIYTLFGTKEDLYRALLVAHAEEATNVFTKALDEGGNAIESLVSYVEAKGRLYEDKVPLARLILNETLGTGISFKSGPDPALRSMYSLWHARLAEVFAGGIANGLFRKGDPLVWAVALEGMTNQFLYQWSEDPNSAAYNNCIALIRGTYLPSLRANQE